MSKNKKISKEHFTNVDYTMPPWLSKKEEKEYARQMEESYDYADKKLKSFHKEGTKLMNKMFKIIEQEEKSNPEDSVFVIRGAEFMVLEWLGKINPNLEYHVTKVNL